ncbi:MAG: hypothetical protein ACUVQC_02345, partial [Thermaceae bacterium]
MEEGLEPRRRFPARSTLVLAAFHAYPDPGTPPMARPGGPVRLGGGLPPPLLALEALAQLCVSYRTIEHKGGPKARP